jgi:hypothetical protein
VATVFFVYPYGRFDILTYGRYSEDLIGPVCLWGLILAPQIEKKRKTFIWLAACFLALTVLTNAVQHYEDPTTNSFFNLSASFWALDQLGYSGNSHYVIFKFIILFSLIAFLIYESCRVEVRRKGATVVLLILTCFSVYKTGYAYNNGSEVWAVGWEEDVSNIRDYILTNNMQDECYVYKNGFEPKVLLLQYLMYDETLHITRNPAECDGYIITSAPEEDELKGAGRTEIYRKANISIWD